jgi:cytochrome c553
MHIRSPYEKINISLLVKKMSKEFIVKCSACHNDYANGIIGPSLLGRDVDYIFNKIADFKSGKKSNPLMNDLINMMNDEEIRKMATQVYNFNKEIESMRNK